MTESEIVRRTLPEQIVDGHRLGRHVVHNPRSRNFAADAAATIKNVQHSAVGLALDQGNIGSCTANALCGALDSAPDNAAAGRQFGENDAVSLYERETEFEGRPYPPNDPGGFGLMVCRAAKQLGWISS
jgi:hypothetical protein